jgi:hypothetical protein
MTRLIREVRRSELEASLDVCHSRGGWEDRVELGLFDGWV